MQEVLQKQSCPYIGIYCNNSCCMGGLGAALDHVNAVKAKELSADVVAMQIKLPETKNFYNKNIDWLTKFTKEIYDDQDFVDRYQEASFNIGELGDLQTLEILEYLKLHLSEEVYTKMIEYFQEEIVTVFVYQNYIEFVIIFERTDHRSEMFLSLLYFKEPFTEESEFRKGVSSYHEILDNPHWVVQIHEVLFPMA